MNLRIKRRQFGQIAIASAATTVLTNIAQKSTAQESVKISGICGVSLSAASQKITEDVATITLANKAPEIIFTALDLVNNLLSSTIKLVAESVTNLQESTQTLSKAVLIKKPSERITAFTANPNGTFTVVTVAATRDGDFTRLTTFPQKTNLLTRTTTIKLRNLKQPSTVESLVAITNTKVINSTFLSIISLQNGLPPFVLAAIDGQGNISTDAKFGFPTITKNLRLSNLAQSPTDGKIYAIQIDSEGNPILVYVNLTDLSLITGQGRIEKVAVLTFNKKPLQKDLASLVFSPSGELFALADPENKGKNLLFAVELNSGEMKLLREFTVDKISFLNS